MASRRSSKRTARPRSLAGLLVVALTGFGLTFLDLGATAGATDLGYTCSGITGDDAGQLGDSKATLSAMSALIGGPLTLAVGIVTDAPAEVKATDPFTANFDVTVNLPDALIDAASGLGLTKVDIANASFAVAVTGGAAANTISGPIPDQTLSLATKPVRVSQRITGQVTPNGQGPIVYRPGTSRMSIGINTTIAGISLKAITVECTAVGAIGSTAFQPPGFPRISPPVTVVNVAPGATSTVDIRSKVSPDAGNPLIEGSLALKGAPSAGSATLSGGTLSFAAPTTPGSYEVDFTMCADPLTTKGAPGADEVQTFTFAEAYPGPELNAHPLFFSLKVGDEETGPIITSYAEIFGIPIPLDMGNGFSLLAHYSGAFVPPTAAKVQAALEALPNVDPGDIVVGGGGATTPYTFTFGGKFARQDVPQITIGHWETWLPASGLTQILEAAKVAAGTPTGPPPPSLETLNAQLFSGQIGLDAWLAGYGESVKAQIIAGIDIKGLLDRVTRWFPKEPEIATATAGEPATPDRTVDACSTGQVQFVVSAPTTTTTPTGPTPTVRGQSAVRPRSAASPQRVQVSFAG